jgi:hypothetical protein
MHPRSRWSGHKELVESDLRRIFDHEERDLGTIDPLALSVLKLADGTRSASAIAEVLSIKKTSVEDAFDRLRSLGLLDGWSAPPTSSSVISRRRAVVDVGRAAAALGAAVGTLAMFGSIEAFAGNSKEQGKKEAKQK